MSSNVPASDQCDTATIRIGPLTLQRLERDGAIALVGAAVAERRKLDLAICNAHTVLLAIDDSSYADTLNRMTLLNDGVGVNLASRMVSGAPFPANLNGTDLIPELLSRIGRPLRLFLLGASQASVEGAARHIADTYPDHEIAGFRNGYFAGEEIDGIIETINAGKVDLLMVAMGNPRQERFITANRDRLDATVCIGVGALFDFMSGSVVRAPKFMRMLGLEWLFRLMQEPGRLGRRYFIGIPRFLLATLRLPRDRDTLGKRPM
ncbi:WecB/TagA/CpsF family glycosyltransferase [Breoghania sp. JC706]|uniref:WecB/TagA/CpsF family glycosyltransferase n=1 Tax=Breoghania sp. JC706 TaxID=3117732 RepID=UPI0030083391